MVVSAPVPSSISDPRAPTTTLGSPRYRREYDAFGQLLEGKRIPAGSLIVLLGKSLLGLVEMAIRYGKGRVCENVLGHDVAAMKSVGFQTLLIRGVEWAATGDVRSAVPEQLKNGRE